MAAVMLLLCVPGCGKAADSGVDAVTVGETAGQGTTGSIAGGNVQGEGLSVGGDVQGTGSAVEKGQSIAPAGGSSAGSDVPLSGNAQVGQSTAPSGGSQAGRGTASAIGNSSDAEGAGFSSWGALSVDGTKLVDSAGNPVQLKGVSTHGLAWYPEYVNKECFQQLKEEWGANVVRLAMYTAEYGGYCTGGSQDELKELVKSGVRYATECDMYVIIDWHILSDGNPNTYIEDAKDFFEEMSREYADSSNVLYEICNEPNGGTSWNDVKQYAEQIIEVIRANDEDGVILVGTPNWCQYVEQAAADPIEGYDNLMYTLHFYAATHTEDLRSAMTRAIAAGLPVFVSEYGICDASGNGAINEYQANQWVDTLNKYQVSYVMWNLSNKGETSSMLKSGCQKTSGFTEEDLSDSGKWLCNMLGNTDSLGQAGNSGTGDAGSGQESGNGQGTGNGNAGGKPGVAVGTGQGAGAEPSAEPGNGTKPGTVQGAGTGQSAGTGQNAESGNGQGNGNESAAGSGQSTQAGQGTLDNGLGISAEMINSWGQNNETYYQYTLTITNDTGADMDNWTVSLVFNGDIALSDGWNGVYQAEGNTLTISSMDYNGRIDTGGSVGNIGFILRGAEDLTICWE